MFKPYLDSNPNIKKLTLIKQSEIWILSGFFIFRNMYVYILHIMVLVIFLESHLLEINNEIFINKMLYPEFAPKQQEMESWPAIGKKRLAWTAEAGE